MLQLQNKKLSCCYDTDRTAYDRTTYGRYTGKLSDPFAHFGYKLRTAGTHDPNQRVEFMNAPKLYLLKRD